MGYKVIYIILYKFVNVKLIYEFFFHFIGVKEIVKQIKYASVNDILRRGHTKFKIANIIFKNIILKCFQTFSTDYINYV